MICCDHLVRRNVRFLEDSLDLATNFEPPGVRLAMRQVQARGVRQKESDVLSIPVASVNRCCSAMPSHLDTYNLLEGVFVARQYIR